jgi:hypothetical protein
VVDAEINTELIEQIERRDDRHRQTNTERQTRVLARVHEREAESCDTQGHRRFRGGEARAPTRQRRDPGPPTDKRRGANCHRDKASSSTRVLSFQAADQGRELHLGFKASRTNNAGRMLEPVRRGFKHKQLRKWGYVCAKIFLEPERGEMAGSYVAKSECQLRAGSAVRFGRGRTSSPSPPKSSRRRRG